MLTAVFDTRQNIAATLPGVPENAESLAALARQCDIILVAVVSANQAIDVLTAPGGVLEGARPGLEFVLLSTVSLEDLERIRKITDAAKIGLVDCGVTGGTLAAKRGLVCLVGSTPEQFDKIRPALEGFSNSVMRMGGPGTGMAAKIARNVIAYGGFLAGYQGALLARAAGVDVKQLSKALDDSAASLGGPFGLINRTQDPRTDAAEAALREHTRILMNKDLEAAQYLAASLRIDLPIASLIRAVDYEVVEAIRPEGEF
jgi:3-hydroxyisobutyrate dehydrogenase